MSFDAGTISSTLTIDRKPFTAGLAAARKQAARFENQTIEPRLEIEGLGEAHTELARLRRELENMEGDAKLDIDTEPARVKIAALQAKLAQLEADEVEIDVDVRRGIDDQIAGIVSSISSLGRESYYSRSQVGMLGRAIAGLGSFVASPALSALEAVPRTLGQMASSVGSFGASIAPMIVLVVAATSALLAMAGVVGALAASFAAAVAAIGALGVAFGSLLAPAVALGVGAFQRFQDTVEKAGSAAHELSKVAGDVATVFQKTVAPAADAVFRGMADGLQSLIPMIRGLQPAFTAFGRAVGDAFRTLGQEFASPAWRQFFDFLLRSAARITPVLTKAFTGFAQILRNIAQAAMPFLVRGLKDIANWLADLGKSTSNIDGLRESIGGLVDHLGSWLNLAKQVGRVVLAFFNTADAQGKSLVDSIADIASGWADWLSTTDGQEAVKQFIDDAIEFIGELIDLVGEFIDFARELMPIFEKVMSVMTDVLSIVNDIIDAIGRIPNPFDGWPDLSGGGDGDGGGFSIPMPSFPGIPTLPDLTPFEDAAAPVANAWVAALAKIRGGMAATNGGAQVMAGGVLAAVGRVTGGFRNMGAGVGAAVANVGRSAALAVGQILPKMNQLGRGMATNIAQGIKGAGQAAAQAARSITQKAAAGARSLGNSFRAVGRTLAGGLAAGLRSTAAAVSGAAKAIAQNGKAAVEGVKGAFQNAGQSNGQAVAAGIRAAASAAKEAAKGLANGALEAAKSIGNSMKDAGIAVGKMFADGIASTAEYAAAAMMDVAAAAANVVPHSEPKDPRSPLRNLAGAGRATIENYIAGLDGNLARAAMQAALDPARQELERSLLAASSPGESARRFSDAAAELPSRLSSRDETFLRDLNDTRPGLEIRVEPIAALPDGRTLGLIGGLATAGQARQPHRTTSRKVIRG
jgi:hypothetical protein